MAVADHLPDDLAAVLRFEARHAGVPDERLVDLVRQAFGIDLIRYRQRLYAAVTHPAAEALEPATVRRLRRIVARHRRGCPTQEA